MAVSCASPLLPPQSPMHNPTAFALMPVTRPRIQIAFVLSAGLHAIALYFLINLQIRPTEKTVPAREHGVKVSISLTTHFPPPKPLMVKRPSQVTEMPLPEGQTKSMPNETGSESQAANIRHIPVQAITEAQNTDKLSPSNLQPDNKHGTVFDPRLRQKLYDTQQWTPPSMTPTLSTFNDIHGKMVMKRGQYCTRFTEGVDETDPGSWSLPYKCDTQPDASESMAAAISKALKNYRGASQP